MGRRSIVTTSEVMKERLGLPATAILLDVVPDHRNGVLRIIVDDPDSPPITEGSVPFDEPLRRQQ